MYCTCTYYIVLVVTISLNKNNKNLPLFLLDSTKSGMTCDAVYLGYVNSRKKIQTSAQILYRGQPPYNT